jgi:hypothetical protein
MHTIDFVLNGHRKVVEEDYSELGSINHSETFIVRFWIYSIDEKPLSEHVSFSGQWDLLYTVDKRIPRLQILVLEPAPVAAFGWTGPRIPSIVTSFQTKQSSSKTFIGLLILVAFLAGTATSGRFRRRR